MLREMLEDLVGVEGMLFVVRGGGATAEVRGAGLEVRSKDRWITIGRNDDPAHIHVDSDIVRHAELASEERPGRTSYSARFFDADGNRVLAGFFTGMYDASGVMIPKRLATYEALAKKYPSKIDL